ncbi:LamG-like jellyroll fold domain-containing protein [Catenovulum sp. SX2]|uniref:LamG-like jellyroll fold domain-containing protein n=1 Tax=Catenovulum sp. SX2 TaxID=3398614 RepID=UPI003F87EFA7
MNKTKVALIVSSVIALASCGSDEGKSGYPENQVPEFPVYEAKPSLSSSVTLVEGKVDFEDIGVHDPSVIKAVVDGVETYYIYGSHLAAAKSTDLINWDYISAPGNATVTHNIDGENKTRDELVVDDSPLFNTYTSEISEGIAWTDGWEGNWAANVIQAPNGKYWFYYNHCAQDEAKDEKGIGGGCWHRSYLGLAEADSPEGPFVDKGVFLRTGYRSQVVDDLDADGNQQFQKDADGNNVLDADGNPIVLTKTIFPEMDTYPLDNGQDTYNPAIDPNAIDPTAFFDKEGKLWMVYGSYSGGIYILELDTTTGMPVAGQGYGKHLVGGDYRSIEGSYVMYSPETDYYYLMWSIAGFNRDGGYNVRIARSKTPDGPYLDPQGNDISTIKGTNEIGGKLIGGFEITQEVGDEAPAWGYAAPGHHSTIYDEATGRHLMVMHTRFPAGATSYPGNSEAHAVRTHEMFVTADDWLVVSPQRYVPIDGDNALDVNSMAGYYKFVDHGFATNTVPAVSGAIWLNENRTVSGSATGNWYMLDKNTIRLDLSSGSYTGVAKWQWDNGRGELVPTFSAMSSAGATVWGSKIDETNVTAATLTAVRESLEIQTEVTIFDEFTLPTIGKNGAAISWESSNTYYIENDGSVFIPTPDRGDQVITMTATISLNGQTAETKSFDVTLKARDGFRNAVAHYSFENDLTDSLQTKADATVTGNFLNNTGGTLVYTDDTYGASVDFDATYGLLFPQDLIQSYEYTVSFWIKPHAFTNFTSSFYGGATADPGGQRMNVMPMGWVGDNFMIWSASGADGVFVDSWQGIPLEDWSHITVTVNEGDQRLYINGTLAASATGMFDLFSADGGVFGLGVNYWDTPLNAQIDELIIYDYALQPLDVNAVALNNLTDESTFPAYVKAGLELGDLSAVRESFELSRVGPFVSGISWESSDTSVLNPVNGVAVVTQPGPKEGDAVVTLTATINYAGFTDTKEFQVTVKSKAPAEYSFEGDLTSAGNSYAAATVTGNRIDNTGGTISYVDGVVGSAVYLDGASGVRFADNLITTFDYSVSFWIKPETFTGFTTSFFGASNTASWVSFVPSWGDDQVTRLWSGSAAWYDADPGGRIAQDEWTHVAFTVSNGDVTLYLNGEVRFEGTGYPNVFSLGQTTYFGLGVNHWDIPFNGAIDEFKIFSEAIDATKVQELFNVGE